MYDFYFGDNIDEEKYLISVKRMLPKWCNSIPDSEYIALYRIAKDIKHPIFVETGVGASTIPLAYLALKNDGKLYSWDICGEKGSYIRNILTETHCNIIDRNINSHWKFIGYDSRDKHLGIPIVGELEEKVDLSFHDSRHTIMNLQQELECVNPLLVNGSVVAIDDGNYSNKQKDYAYINIMRKKLGLPEVESPQYNKSDFFYKEVDYFLKLRWKNVEHIKDYYKENYKNDLFFNYYGAEIDIRASLNMEKIDNLEHRFDAWKVSDRK